MAKYEVTHTCGHVHEYNLFGKHTERDRKITWLEGQECPECRRKATEDKAMEAIKGMDLPELEGTPKQVAWANTIRAKMILGIRENAEMVRGEKRVCIDRFKWIKEDEAIDIISSRKKAKTFIDWRHEGSSALIASILDSAQQ